MRRPWSEELLQQGTRGQWRQAGGVTDKGGEIYTVTNPNTVADHQGHHVKVDGKLDESAKTITVATVEMLK